jgi:hypothetical protein
MSQAVCSVWNSLYTTDSSQNLPRNSAHRRSLLCCAAVGEFADEQFGHHSLHADPDWQGSLGAFERVVRARRCPAIFARADPCLKLDSGVGQEHG